MDLRWFYFHRWELLHWHWGNHAITPSPVGQSCDYPVASEAILNTDASIIRIYQDTGLILGLRPLNGRRRYFVTTSPIGWAQT